jgi:hypothetical protein
MSNVLDNSYLRARIRYINSTAKEKHIKKKKVLSILQFHRGLSKILISILSKQGRWFATWITELTPLRAPCGAHAEGGYLGKWVNNVLNQKVYNLATLKFGTVVCSSHGLHISLQIPSVS